LRSSSYNALMPFLTLFWCDTKASSNVEM
jgi:hypothetical protein